VESGDGKPFLMLVSLVVGKRRIAKKDNLEQSSTPCVRNLSKHSQILAGGMTDSLDDISG